MTNILMDAVLTGAGYVYHRTFLSRSEHWDAVAVKHYQTSKLKKLFRCAANAPWYQNEFKKISCDVRYDDPWLIYDNLPVLHKNSVRESPGLFKNSRFRGPQLQFSTSGTTGSPLTVLTSYNQWIVEQGIIWRAWKRAGFALGDRVAILRSYAPLAGQPKIKFDRLRNWKYFSVYHMDEDSLWEYANELQSWRPKFLRGYPSSLFEFSKFIKRNKVILPQLQGVFTASEMLSIEMRTQIEDALGVCVFDHYGQAEITAMLHDCEYHDGMHVDWEYGFVDLVPDGARPGPFRMLATNLHNYAMPLIKYDTGDLIHDQLGACPCGRTSPRVGQILGRATDYVIDLRGARVPGVNLYTHFSKLQLTRQVQIVQRVPGHLEVHVCPWDSSDQQQFLDEITECVARLTSVMNVMAHVHQRSELPKSKSGKQSFIIQEVSE